MNYKYNYFSFSLVQTCTAFFTLPQVLVYCVKEIVTSK